MVAPTNIRFPSAVEAALTDVVRQTGASKSSVVVTAVREWLQLQAHPRLRFADTVSGDRRASLLAGPQVWTVAESWLQHDGADRTPQIVADATGLAVADVEAALAYWADFRDEIDDTIRVEHDAQDAALAAFQRRQALNAV